MKRTFSLLILAAVAAALLPLAAICQDSPTTNTKSQDKGDRPYRYEVYAGYAYTSLNQVNQSRYGLQGFTLSATRDWAKYFGTTAEGSYYKYATNTGNPGTPSVDTVLFGPVVHADLFGKYSLFVDLLAGGERIASSFSLSNNTSGLAYSPHMMWNARATVGLVYRF